MLRDEQDVDKTNMQKLKGNLTLKALKYFCINLGDQRVFEFVINGLVGFLGFISIPMLWVYGQYKYLHSYSAGIDRLIDPRTVRVDHKSC